MDVDTYFAPAQRASEQELRRSLEFVSRSEVIDSLMTLAGGLIAVLNQHRQILSVNHAYLEFLGIDDIGGVLGLRPGEAINCTHARDMPGGCGTSFHCVTCGAAIAITTCRDLAQPVEQKCMLTTRNGGQTTDRFFLVRASALSMNGEPFILLFMQDATIQQQRAALERVFLHDLSNLAGGILGTADYLAVDPGDKSAGAAILDMARRLAREIKIQRAIHNNDLADYVPLLSDVPVPQLLQSLRAVFAQHPDALNKHLAMQDDTGGRVLRSDFFLLVRILENMIKNALEATGPDGRVRVDVSSDGDRVVFSVWNRKAIPPAQAARIFQRNYSTKSGPGRGLGTYCMKLFGESVLGGRVAFTSTEEQGTVFTLSLPAPNPAP